MLEGIFFLVMFKIFGYSYLKLLNAFLKDTSKNILRSGNYSMTVYF